jgi:hypothetical protein
VPGPRRRLAAAISLAVLSACSTSAVEREPDAPAPRPAAPDIAAAADTDPNPPRLQGDFVAVPRGRLTPMWERPAADRDADFSLDTRNPTGELAPMLIEDATVEGGEVWYEVLLPLRPNGVTAWVREDAVEVIERAERIEVDLSRRLLWHYVDDELAHRFRVGVGTPETPTGTGRFYVWVKVDYDDPSGPYGTAALGLSGFSPVLSDWPGEGRMAVHGTADPGDRGRPVSHGCVRVFNEDLSALVDVPLGTPVEIRA